MTRRAWTALAAAMLATAWTGARAGAPPAATTREAPAAAPAGPESRAVRQGDAESGRVGRDSGGSWRGWVRTIAALAVVVALVFAVRWALRRLAPGAKARRLPEAVEVLGRTVVSARQQVLLVRLGRRVVLVGLGPEGMSTLSEVTDADEVAALLGDAPGDGPGETDPPGGKGAGE